MKLAILWLVFWMFINHEGVLCASLNEVAKSVVKRDVDVNPAIFHGVVDTTLDLLDQSSNGFAVSGRSKFDEAQKRKRRSPIPCERNGTASTSGATNGINTRNATNPDVVTLGRRKRSAQTNSSPTNSRPTGPPPNGAPSPRNGPPPNGSTPNGPPSNGSPDGGQPNLQIEEPECNNSTAFRSQRSPQMPNGEFPPRERNGNEQRRSGDNNNVNGYGGNQQGRRPGQDWDNENKNMNGNGNLNGYGGNQQAQSQDWNLENGNRNLNGYGGNQQERGQGQSWDLQNGNGNLNGYGGNQQERGQGQSWDLQNGSGTLNGYGGNQQERGQGQSWDLQNGNGNLNGYGGSQQ